MTSFLQSDWRAAVSLTSIPPSITANSLPLVTLAVKLNPDFIEWFEAAEQITPYATAYRYPGEILEPDADEFKGILKIAEKFYEYICSILPPEVSAR